VVPYTQTNWLRARHSRQRLLPNLSVDCIFDAGAGHGEFGDQLRDVGYRGIILSFEPLRAQFKTLSERAATRPPWKVFPYLLGAENGRAELTIDPESPNSFAQEAVEVRRLDSIFGECMAGIAARRLYLKLDTPGLDLEALRGADGVLDKFLGVHSVGGFVASGPARRLVVFETDSISQRTCELARKARI
jgi:FkbM family methyltransferase